MLKGGRTGKDPPCICLVFAFSLTGQNYCINGTDSSKEASDSLQGLKQGPPHRISRGRIGSLGVARETSGALFRPIFGAVLGHITGAFVCLYLFEFFFLFEFRWPEY